MIITKTGYEHLRVFKNNQDGVFECGYNKGVADGCSQGESSEVGAKLFCQFMKNELENKVLSEEGIKEKVKLFFDRFNFFYGEDRNVIKNYFLFTFIIVSETEEDFLVSYCGDGYILKESHNCDIDIEELPHYDSPPYFAYNYVPDKYLTEYTGKTMEIQFKRISKKEYRNVGCATDGLMYLLRLDNAKEIFSEGIKSKKRAIIGRYINRHSIDWEGLLDWVDELDGKGLKEEIKKREVLKDDVTIVM